MKKKLFNALIFTLFLICTQKRIYSMNAEFYSDSVSNISNTINIYDFIKVSPKAFLAGKQVFFLKDKDGKEDDKKIENEELTSLYTPEKVETCSEDDMSESKFKCKYCYVGLKNNRQVIRHIKLEHPQEKAYCCFWPECDYSASTSEKLAYHRKRKHFQKNKTNVTHRRRRSKVPKVHS